ncbi:hypothetical protein [Streptomyces chrestomyceticus]|uniref:hypothetical protein n=1 Tax=Streptomyces chrestomyceticus TaxID=68185 RepID=UPI0033FD8B55
MARREAVREARGEALEEPRYLLRTAAFRASAAARAVAALVDAEGERAPWDTEVRRREGHPERAAWWTRAAVALEDAAAAVMAAAVAADRAAGDTWAAVGEALGVSADTAARRYRKE